MNSSPDKGSYLEFLFVGHKISEITPPRRVRILAVSTANCKTSIKSFSHYH